MFLIYIYTLKTSKNCSMHRKGSVVNDVSTKNVFPVGYAKNYLIWNRKLEERLCHFKHQYCLVKTTSSSVLILFIENSPCSLVPQEALIPIVYM